MYEALFEITSWMGTKQHTFKGKSASEILSKLEKVQSLECLVNMGRMEEDTAEGQRSLDSLENLLEKQRSRKLTIEDLKTLNVKISLGEIKCLSVSEVDA